MSCFCPLSAPSHIIATAEWGNCLLQSTGTICAEGEKTTTTRATNMLLGYFCHREVPFSIFTKGSQRLVPCQPQGLLQYNAAKSLQHPIALSGSAPLIHCGLSMVSDLVAWQHFAKGREEQGINTFGGSN